MPPPRGRKKKAAPPAVDILDRVLDTATVPHSVDIGSLKQEIEEQLRVLKVRAAPKLGKGDSIESRKLVLLEQKLRASSSSSDVCSLNAQTLAKAVGMKTAAFENLSFQVSQYVDVSKPGNSRKKKTPRVVSSSKSVDSQQSQSERSVVRSVDHNEDEAMSSSTIPALSIRLGPIVHDSHGFAQRAQHLFQDMEHYVRSTSTISSHHKRGYLHDMSRLRAAYEAACFYLVATQGRRKLKKTALVGRGASDTTTLSEEDGLHQLGIQDVLRASTSNVSATEFRDILPIVEKFAGDMEETEEGEGRKRQATKASKRKRVSSTKNGQESIESKANEPARALLEGVEAAAAATTGNTKRTRLVSTEETAPMFVYNPKFLEWKNRTLRETSETMKRAIAWERGTDTEGISDGEAIRRAADEILQRHGPTTD